MATTGSASVLCGLTALSSDHVTLTPKPPFLSTCPPSCPLPSLHFTPESYTPGAEVRKRVSKAITVWLRGGHGRCKEKDTQVSARKDVSERYDWLQKNREGILGGHRIWFLPPQFSASNSGPIAFPTLLLGVSVTHAIINQEDAISAILPHQERHQEALLWLL